MERSVTADRTGVVRTVRATSAAARMPTAHHRMFCNKSGFCGPGGSLAVSSVLHSACLKTPRPIVPAFHRWGRLPPVPDVDGDTPTAAIEPDASEPPTDTTVDWGAITAERPGSFGPGESSTFGARAASLHAERAWEDLVELHLRELERPSIERDT